VDLRPLQENIEVRREVPEIEFAYFLEEAVDENGGVRLLVAVDPHIGVKHFRVGHKNLPFVLYSVVKVRRITATVILGASVMRK